MFFRGGSGSGCLRLLVLLGSITSYSPSLALPLATGKMFKQLMALAAGLGCSGVGGGEGSAASREPRGVCEGFSAFPFSPCMTRQAYFDWHLQVLVVDVSLSYEHASQIGWHCTRSMSKSTKVSVAAGWKTLTSSEGFSTPEADLEKGAIAAATQERDRECPFLSAGGPLAPGCPSGAPSLGSPASKDCAREVVTEEREPSAVKLWWPLMASSSLA